MSDTKHTLGPLRIGDETDAWHIYCDEAKEGFERIATINYTGGNSEAYARLFASATDLLAACKAVIAKQDDASIFRLLANREAINLVRAAIAKAKGETQ